MASFDVERVIEVRQLRNRLEEIRGTVFSHRQPLTQLRCCVTGRFKGPESMPKSGWRPFKIMERWGGLDQTTWFRMTARVPKAFAGQRVATMIRPCAYTDIPGLRDHDQTGEGLAYVNGNPFQGIDRNHEILVLTEKARGDEVFDIAIECTPQTRFDATHEFECADLAVMHRDAWDFYWDGTAYLDLIQALDRNQTTCRRMLNLVREAVWMVDLQAGGGPDYHASLAEGRRLLREGLKNFTSHGMGQLTLIGQSHIDTAWLWPLRETRRKVGRTWSTVMRLMELYPEFHFSASQPELFLFAKECHPELWKQIKKRVKQGRFEPCGATWVEQDSNMPCGEALVRQFLYGNRFYEQEFGFRSRTAWLPDAFGFPWSLPQIMRKAGIEYFFTIKISWSQFTKFPYGYFLWQGVDGSSIPAIMTPMNYNGNPVPADLIRQREAFSQKELVDEEPFPFGYGDGGGGPTMEMIEYGKRFGNVHGVPQCTFGRTEDCFDRMREEVPEAHLPVHNGELYLELHRGCQTTQGRTKRHNRKAEVLLHDAELLSSMALLHGGKYGQKTLFDAWRIVLTNQFHDILPGSSITEVYEDTEKDYARAREYAGSALDSAVGHLLSQIAMDGPGTPIVVFNTLSWLRSDVARARVKLPRGAFHVIAPDGGVVPSQRLENGEVLFEAYDVPPLGYAVYRVVKGEAPTDASGILNVSDGILENHCLEVRLDQSGRFVSVYDKVEDREVLAPGRKGNVLQIFDDRPGANDAWDIDHNFEALGWEPGPAKSVEVIEEGPVRAVIRVVRKTEHSTFTQDITLYALLPRVEVATHVEWHEKHALLKVAFPVNILSSRATYHIQYGTIERATHANTDLDFARFEVPAQHWADLSEGNYGVSLLNDCKYGYDVKGNTLRLSLLRAPVDPDPHADEGHHQFTYALFPHSGDWRNGTVSQGFEMNVPLLAVAAAPNGGSLPSTASFGCVDTDHVLIDAVKKAEDSEAIIVRVYEACGERGPAAITFGPKPRKAAECNLMEENDKTVKLRKHTLEFYIKPYEIRTFKVVF
jgi:alpha-mannosidase